MDILVINNRQDSIDFITRLLERENHEITIEYSIDDVVKNGLEFNHDLIILDLFSEEGQDKDFIVNLRKHEVNIPILILSSNQNVAKKVDLLRSGADDYMIKPIDDKELLARIYVLHQRYLGAGIVEKESHGNICFYWKQNKVVRRGKDIFLTSKEGQLLKILVRNHGKIVKSSDLIEKIWNVDPAYHSNVLQSLVRHLRRRIDSGFEHKLIKNIHGVGYMFIFAEN